MLCTSPHILTHLNFVPLLKERLEPGQTAVTEELVAADLDVVQAAEEGRHVLQGGEVVVAQVETPQAVEASQGCWAEVCEAGVVRERQSLGEG